MFRFAHSVDVPAHIELAFVHGVPVAVNGIAMSLPELNEAVTTIAEDHGIGDPPAGQPSLAAEAIADSLAELVLGQARAALAATTEHLDSGVVRMRLHEGEHIVESVAPATPARHS